jgi:anti-sigma regulatory factor (Ser/Thr protein kinase)
VTALPTPEQESSDSSQRVELSLAADAQMLFLARMTGAAVAAQAQFGYEQVEDVRLAVDELCIRLMRYGSGGRIRLVLEWDDLGVVTVRATLQPGPDAPGASVTTSLSLGPDSELSERILDALVDDHGYDKSNGDHQVWLRVKRKLHTV